jgi:hypothetical protein
MLFARLSFVPYAVAKRRPVFGVPPTRGFLTYPPLLRAQPGQSPHAELIGDGGADAARHPGATLRWTARVVSPLVEATIRFHSAARHGAAAAWDSRLPG